MNSCGVRLSLATKLNLSYYHTNYLGYFRKKGDWSFYTKLRKGPHAHSVTNQRITGCPFQSLSTLLLLGFSVSLSTLCAHKAHTNQSQLYNFDLSFSLSSLYLFLFHRSPVSQSKPSLSLYYYSLPIAYKPKNHI